MAQFAMISNILHATFQKSSKCFRAEARELKKEQELSQASERGDQRKLGRCRGIGPPGNLRQKYA